MPADQRVWFNDHECLQACGPHAIEPNPEYAFVLTEAEPFSITLGEHCQLLTQSEYFKLQYSPAAQNVDQAIKQRYEYSFHAGNANGSILEKSRKLIRTGFLVGTGWVSSKPKIVRFKEDKGRIVYLTVNQARNLVECAKGDNNAQIYPFIVIGLSTGMRVSEILSIRKKYINLERRIIYIPKAKAGAREQPITIQLQDFLAGHVQELQEDCRSQCGESGC